MVNPDVWAPTPTLIPDVIILPATTTPAQFTTNLRLWAKRFIIEADPLNAGGTQILIGLLQADGTVPTDILITGAGAGQVNAIGVLNPGDSFEPPTGKWQQYVGQQFQLAQLVAKISAGTGNVRLHRVKRGYGVSP